MLEFLKTPLTIDHGHFTRTTEEQAYAKYVELFFSARKYETAGGLAFGMDLDHHSWINAEGYFRFLVDEFNRYHQGQMSLKFSGQTTNSDVQGLNFILRSANQRFSIRVASHGNMML